MYKKLSSDQFDSEVFSTLSKLDVYSAIQGHDVDKERERSVSLRTDMTYMTQDTLARSLSQEPTPISYRLPANDEVRVERSTPSPKKNRSIEEDYVETLSDAYLEKLKSKLPNKIVLVAKKKGESLLIRKLYDEEPAIAECTNSFITDSLPIDVSEMLEIEDVCNRCICGCEENIGEKKRVTLGKVKEEKKALPHASEKKWEILFIERLRNCVNRQISRMDSLEQTTMEDRLYNETGWLTRKDEKKNSILNNLNLYDLFLASKKPTISYEEELKRAQEEEEEFLRMVEKEVLRVKEYLVCCMSDKSAALVDTMIEYEEMKYKDRLKCCIENMANDSKNAIKRAKLTARTSVADEQAHRFKMAKAELTDSFKQRLNEFNNFITDASNFEKQWKIHEKEEYFRIKVQKLSEKCNQLNSKLMEVTSLREQPTQIAEQTNVINQLTEAYNAAIEMFSNRRINKHLKLAKALSDRANDIKELSLCATELGKMNENLKLVVERLINQFQKLINFVTKERPIQNAYLLSLDRLFKHHLDDFNKAGRENLAFRERQRREKLEQRKMKRESSTESQPTSKLTRSTYQDSSSIVESSSHLLTAADRSRLCRSRLTSRLKGNKKCIDKTTEESSGESTELEYLLRQAIQVVGKSAEKGNKSEMKSQASLKECTSNREAEDRLGQLLKTFVDKPEAKKLYLNF